MHASDGLRWIDISPSECWKWLYVRCAYFGSGYGEFFGPGVLCQTATTSLQFTLAFTFDEPRHYFFEWGRNIVQFLLIRGACGDLRHE